MDSMWVGQMNKYVPKKAVKYSWQNLDRVIWVFTVK